MKEYFKLREKEQELSLELSRNQLSSLKEYKSDNKTYFKEELE